jgi:hypothetical protein
MQIVSALTGESLGCVRKRDTFLEMHSPVARHLQLHPWQVQLIDAEEDWESTSTIPIVKRNISTGWFWGNLWNDDLIEGRFFISVIARFENYLTEKSVIEEFAKYPKELLGNKYNDGYTPDEEDSDDDDGVFENEEVFHQFCEAHGGYILFNSDEGLFKIIERGPYFNFSNMYIFENGEGYQAPRFPVDSFSLPLTGDLPPRGTYFQCKCEITWFLVSFNQDDMDSGIFTLNVLEQFDDYSRERVVEVISEYIAPDMFEGKGLALINSNEHLFKLINGHGYIKFDSGMTLAEYLTPPSDDSCLNPEFLSDDHGCVAECHEYPSEDGITFHIVKGRFPDQNIWNMHKIPMIYADTMDSIMARISNCVKKGEDGAGWYKYLSVRYCGIHEIYVYDEHMYAASGIVPTQRLPHGDVHIIWEGSIAYVIMGSENVVKSYGSAALVKHHTQLFA